LPSKEGERLGNQRVDALGIEAGAGLQRLGRFTRQLDDALCELRGLGDEAVERSASQFRLDLEEFAGDLASAGSSPLRSLLDALTARSDNVLTDRLGAASGDLAGLDERSTFALVSSVSSSAAFCDLAANCWLRSPASETSC
jgi:hypothetical protein